MPLLYHAGALLMMLFPTPAHAAGQVPWLPSIISDHMLVQAGKPVPVWGRDVVGTAVRVELNGQSTTATAGADGSWSVNLAAMKAGGPYVLTVAGSSTRTVQDVLVGELWLGSGQSNMELAMRVSQDRDTTIPAATDNQLRLFTADRVASAELLDDVRGSWQVCSPDSVKDFSAVAYHFSRSLRSGLKVPVGMIVASWGGTPAEDWTPRAALEQEPAVKELLAGWDADSARQLLWRQGQPFDLWLKSIRFVPKVGSKAGVVNVAFEKPGAEDWGGAWGHSEKFDSKGSFEAVSDKAGTLGHYSGSIHGGAWGSALCPLKNNASVDLSEYAAVELMVKGSGHFLPTLGQPNVKDYDFHAGEAFELSDSWKAVRIPLATLKQGGWGTPREFTAATVSSLNFSLRVPYWPDLGALVYNGMLHPLTRLPIQGVIWYQGESNTGRAAQYQAVLSRMIASWREAFAQPKLPFYIVQLPGWADAGTAPWGLLREAQRQVSETVPNTGLVSTLDVGESHDIHPKDKTPVGERLAALALGAVYGKAGTSLVPKLLEAKAKGAEVSLRFSHVDKGLVLHGDGGFELAGADGVFHPAKATPSEARVKLLCAELSEPKQVRHAWANDPQGFTLAKDGQPLPAFQTSLP